jgi:GH15 family glucan-1,4-alpha-glucosidase
MLVELNQTLYAVETQEDLMDTNKRDQRYPPIAEYAFISDCHSSALISRTGSIDWCCMPRIDSAPCFGRLLDWQRGGYCRLAPIEAAEISRRYLDDTLVLETVFEGRGVRARILDFFPMRKGGRHNPFKQVLRVIEGLQGQMAFSLECFPRFDYGFIKPWVRKTKKGFLALGGSTGLLISGNMNLMPTGRHGLSGTCTVSEGRHVFLSIQFGRPEDLEDGLIEPPSTEESHLRFQQTVEWWRSWVKQGTFTGPESALVLRSAVVLKGLSNAPTGAIAAAATTSLPEAPGGSRNWDYRFSWVRDSYFTVHSLTEIGYVREAEGFRRFVERSCAGSAEELQILFGVGGERRLLEFEIPDFEGYRGAAPVRVGNAAEKQVQLDVYGELLDLAWNWHKRGHSPDDDYWVFLVELVNTAAKKWKNPDRGIWEMRGEPRHFTLSKAMCWLAVERGVMLAKELGRAAPLDEWLRTRGEIRAWLDEQGYDHSKGVFIQAAGYPVMDASLLLLPIFGIMDSDDERMVRTVEAIRRDLGQDGLLRRYRSDELRGEEGVFLACSFWLAECLAGQGKIADAKSVFQRAVSTANDLGLFSEEFDTQNREMLGNFPQGLTHLSLISAAVAIGRPEAP